MPHDQAWTFSDTYHMLSKLERVSVTLFDIEFAIHSVKIGSEPYDLHMCAIVCLVFAIVSVVGAKSQKMS